VCGEDDRRAAIDLHHGAQPGRFLLIEPARVTEARIVDENADIEILYGRNDPLGAVRICQVGGDNPGVHSEALLDLPGELLQPIAPARAQNERDTLCRKRPRECATDSSRSTCHQSPVTVTLGKGRPRGRKALPRVPKSQGERADSRCADYPGEPTPQAADIQDAPEKGA